jgi:hypothetical protein
MTSFGDVRMQLSPAERAERGRAARKQTPRSRQSAIEAASGRAPITGNTQPIGLPADAAPTRRRDHGRPCTSPSRNRSSPSPPRVLPG